MNTEQDPDVPPTVNKTRARQGRIVGRGRVARTLAISLALLVVVGIVLFYVF